MLTETSDARGGLFMESLVDVGKVALAALLSLAVLFVLTKLMGVKQVSQMTVTAVS